MNNDTLFPSIASQSPPRVYSSQRFPPTPATQKTNRRRRRVLDPCPIVSPLDTIYSKENSQFDYRSRGKDHLLSRTFVYRVIQVHTVSTSCRPNYWQGIKKHRPWSPWQLLCFRNAEKSSHFVYPNTQHSTRPVKVQCSLHTITALIAKRTRLRASRSTL